MLSEDNFSLHNRSLTISVIHTKQVINLVMRQISRSLDSIIAQATFSAVKLGATRSYEDILFLELITHRDSLSFQMLSSRLNVDQMEHLESQLRRMVSVPYSESELSAAGVTAELFYRDLVTALSSRYPEARRISTLHALHFVVANPESYGSQLLSSLGVNTTAIEQEIVNYCSTTTFTPVIEIGLSGGHSKGAKHPAIYPKRSKIEQHPLQKFGTDLTELALTGGIDPVVGRGREIERVIEILSRRKKNNPVLVGEAGVGKSAIVEGLALRIASGEVPHTLQGKRLFSIEISSLVAGTKFRGEFEQRMQQLLDALRESRDSIIFIDEIHTIVGAGSTQGSLDTANILKPALARGEIQTIGATTFDEYRTNIEVDSALERRLQKVVVEPTTVEQSIEILRKISLSYETHHRVIYSDEAIEACVKLSDRYITDRHLPDKAIDLMDESGARAAISRGVSDVIPTIQRPDIEQIVTSITGIEVERLSGDELKRLKSLERHLGGRVVGQCHAVSKLARTIRRSRAGLADDSRPIGVFMFVGPTGVGKTHLAKELSRWMFGSERSLIRLDMSEYGESHNASRLIGSPPGYVGYGEGGELSEAVRRNPYSVVLLDEIEKAHPDIFNVMLQIFDDGQLTDGSGRKIDFRNTIIIMTSNVGSRSVVNRPAAVGFATSSKICSEQSAPEASYRQAMERSFAPEFLNRIDEVLLFRPLEQCDIEKIVTLELERIFDRTRNLGYGVRITAAARKALAALGYQQKYGARALRRTLLERVEDPLSDLIIDGDLKIGGEVIIERERGGNGVKLRVA